VGGWSAGLEEVEPLSGEKAIAARRMGKPSQQGGWVDDEKERQTHNEEDRPRGQRIRERQSHGSHALSHDGEEKEIELPALQLPSFFASDSATVNGTGAGAPLQ
jgi:hypothetical protein